jgi:membrane-associated PAP2 superfamily phosphatase
MSTLCWPDLHGFLTVAGQTAPIEIDKAYDMQKLVIRSGDIYSAGAEFQSGLFFSWQRFVMGLLLVTSLLFVMFPSLDLAVTRYFAHGSTFPLSQNDVLVAVRDVNRRLFIYVLLGVAAMALLHAYRPRRYAVCEPHKCLFVLLTFLAGPLITVQALKLLIGRARPRNIVEFGGTADFTPVWQFAAQCGHSCSFPSGEAATAAALLSVLVLVPTNWRQRCATILLPILIFISLNRVVFGAHFLSDVVIAWGLMLWVMNVLWRFISNRSEAIDRAMSLRR